MCLSASKRSADAELTPTKASKRMRCRLTSAEDTSNDTQFDCRPSSQHDSTIKEYAYELLETLERLEYHVEYMEADRIRDREELEETRMIHLQEVEELRANHEQELKRYRERIDTLADETQYLQALQGILTDDVERLVAETDLNKREIEGYISRGVKDGMDRRATLVLMRDTIVEMFENANL
ncbi:hypothetical protein F4604DRAFT_1917261 [Suillus subluteus]|nr:hypothetical protein F4604DRAFT_1917261 [Suillus subluteus]